MTDTDTAARSATLYRMILPDHICPFGVKALALLEDRGFEVDDRILDTREATDAFMAEPGLDTTLLIVIGDEEVGGYDDLRRRFAAER
ncbi:MAG: glutaredoxin [Sphingomonadales bacterium]|nr:glutaredoxin [Sphingomonadales bacterium]